MTLSSFSLEHRAESISNTVKRDEETNGEGETLRHRSAEWHNLAVQG